MKRCQGDESVERLKRALTLLTESDDKNLYAESLSGPGSLRYLSTGQRGMPAHIDYYYSLGGYFWYGEPNEVWWVGVDSRHGCALSSWHPQKGVRIFYRKQLPGAFKVIGISNHGMIVIQNGILTRDQFMPSDNSVIYLQRLQPKLITATSVFQEPLADFRKSFSAVRGSQFVVFPPIAGEYSEPGGRFLIRVAQGEGENASLSIWEHRQDRVHRVSDSLQDISSWFWIPHKKGVVAATNRIYGDRSGVFEWTGSEQKWVALRTYSDVETCLIKSASTDGVVVYRVEQGKHKHSTSLRVNLKGKH